MCQAHWDKLRAAIAERGLSALVAESGEQAATNMVRELQEGPTLDNYDPLMAAYWAIGSNGLQFLSDLGANPLASMFGGAEDHEKCVICHLNWMMDEHDRVCVEPDCQKPRGELAHYEWMIDRAADDQVEHWKSMQ